MNTSSNFFIPLIKRKYKLTIDVVPGFAYRYECIAQRLIEPVGRQTKTSRSLISAVIASTCFSLREELPLISHAQRTAISMAKEESASIFSRPIGRVIIIVIEFHSNRANIPTFARARSTRFARPFPLLFLLPLFKFLRMRGKGLGPRLGLILVIKEYIL